MAYPRFMALSIDCCNVFLAHDTINSNFPISDLHCLLIDVFIGFPLIKIFFWLYTSHAHLTSPLYTACGQYDRIASLLNAVQIGRYRVQIACAR